MTEFCDILKTNPSELRKAINNYGKSQIVYNFKSSLHTKNQNNDFRFKLSAKITFKRLKEIYSKKWEICYIKVSLTIAAKWIKYNF